MKRRRCRRWCCRAHINGNGLCNISHIRASNTHTCACSGLFRAYHIRDDEQHDSSASLSWYVDTTYTKCEIFYLHDTRQRRRILNRNEIESCRRRRCVWSRLCRVYQIHSRTLFVCSGFGTSIRKSRNKRYNSVVEWCWLIGSAKTFRKYFAGDWFASYCS